jgi:hypothetical protein
VFPQSRAMDPMDIDIVRTQMNFPMLPLKRSLRSHQLPVFGF